MVRAVDVIVADAELLEVSRCVAMWFVVEMCWAFTPSKANFFTQVIFGPS